mgnify:CR=1 FL=1
MTPDLWQRLRPDPGLIVQTGSKSEQNPNTEPGPKSGY